LISVTAVRTESLRLLRKASPRLDLEVFLTPVVAALPARNPAASVDSVNFTVRVPINVVLFCPVPIEFTLETPRGYGTDS
jgi:hypothetical protein